MNFVAGLILYVAQNGDFRENPRVEKEEEVFWMLLSLMSDGCLSGFYRRHFPLLRRFLWAFDELAKQHLPELQAHFAQEGVQHAVYLHQWFLTLYINCLPLPTVLVFWDTMMCGGDGLQAILPITISLLQVLQDVLLSLPFEEIVRFFKTMRLSEAETDSALIGRLVVSRCRDIVLDARIIERLRAPLPDDRGQESGCSPNSAEVPEDFAMDQRGEHHNDGSKEEGHHYGADGIAQSSLFGSYLQSFTDFGRVELPQGVRTWLEDARGNLERAGNVASPGQAGLVVEDSSSSSSSSSGGAPMKADGAAAAYPPHHHPASRLQADKAERGVV